MKEGRLPQFAPSPGPTVIGAGARRTFGLTEVYVLRLVEALATGAGLDVSSATAIVDDLRGVELVKQARNVSDVEPIPVAATFEGRVGWAPQTWPEEWRHRDLSDPYFRVAKRTAALGWRAHLARQGEALADVLFRLPRPEAEDVTMSAATLADCEAADVAIAPAGVVLINMTRELVAVDAALAPLLKDPAA